MQDPKTLDELYGLLHSSCGGQFALGGGRWHNKNFFPGSTDAETAEFFAERKGKLATEVPYCPFWELVRDCATLAGIEPEGLSQAAHFCGWHTPERHNAHDYSVHGLHDEPYASCQGVAMLLGDQLRRSAAKSPPSWQIEQAYKEPPEKRDAIFARMDTAKEGKKLRETFVERVAAVNGERPESVLEATRTIREYLERLCTDALGSTDASPTFYFFRGQGCSSAPEHR